MGSLWIFKTFSGRSKKLFFIAIFIIKGIINKETNKLPKKTIKISIFTPLEINVTVFSNYLYIFPNHFKPSFSSLLPFYFPVAIVNISFNLLSLTLILSTIDRPPIVAQTSNVKSILPLEYPFTSASKYTLTAN